MTRFRRILTIALLVTLTCLSHAYPTPKDHGKDPKTKDSDVKALVKALEKLIEELPTSSFDGDTILTQTVDKLNDYTSYKLPSGLKKTSKLYERSHNDEDKKAIVLLPSEDHITDSQHKKKTYIGLRRKKEGKYYVFHIYVRDPTDKEEGVSLGDEKKIVEYDAWANRVDKYASQGNALGWDECSSSIFVPCKTSERFGLAPPRLVKKHPKTKSKKKKKEPKDIKVKTKDGSDPDENADFFYDLVEDIQKARFFGMFNNMMGGGASAGGGLMGPVQGIVNGALGTVGGLVGNMGGGAGGLGGVVNGALGTVGGLVGQMGPGGLVGNLLGGGGSPGQSKGQQQGQQQQQYTPEQIQQLQLLQLQLQQQQLAQQQAQAQQQPGLVGSLLGAPGNDSQQPGLVASLTVGGSAPAPAGRSMPGSEGQTSEQQGRFIDQLLGGGGGGGLLGGLLGGGGGGGGLLGGLLGGGGAGGGLLGGVGGLLAPVGGLVNGALGTVSGLVGSVPGGNLIGGLIGGGAGGQEGQQQQPGLLASLTGAPAGRSMPGSGTESEDPLTEQKGRFIDKLLGGLTGGGGGGGLLGGLLGGGGGGGGLLGGLLGGGVGGLLAPVGGLVNGALGTVSGLVGSVPGGNLIGGLLGGGAAGQEGQQQQPGLLASLTGAPAGRSMSGSESEDPLTEQKGRFIDKLLGGLTGGAGGGGLLGGLLGGGGEGGGGMLGGMLGGAGGLLAPVQGLVNGAMGTVGGLVGTMNPAGLLGGLMGAGGGAAAGQPQAGRSMPNLENATDAQKGRFIDQLLGGLTGGAGGGGLLGGLLGGGAGAGGGGGGLLGGMLGGAGGLMAPVQGLVNGAMGTVGGLVGTMNPAGLLGGLMGAGGGAAGGQPQAGRSMPNLENATDAQKGRFIDQLLGGLTGGAGGGGLLGGLLGGGAGGGAGGGGLLGGMLGGAGGLMAPVQGLVNGAMGTVGGLVGTMNPAGLLGGLMGAGGGAAAGQPQAGRSMPNLENATDAQKGRFIDQLLGGLTGGAGGGGLLGGLLGGGAGGGGGMLGGMLGGAGGLMAPVQGLVNGAMGTVGGLVGTMNPAGLLGGLMGAGGGAAGGQPQAGRSMPNLANATDAQKGRFLNAIMGMMGGGGGGGGMLGGMLGGGGGMLGGASPNTGWTPEMGEAARGALPNSGPPNMLGGLFSSILDIPVKLLAGAASVVTGVVGGIANAFGGLFGGLGTPNAQPVEVGLSVGINHVDQGIYDLPDYAEQEANQEFKNPASGGLGGLLGLEIEITDDEEPEEVTTTTAKPKKKKKKRTTTVAPSAAAAAAAPAAGAGAEGGVAAEADAGADDPNAVEEEEVIIDDGLQPIAKRRKRSAEDYRYLTYNKVDEQKARFLQLAILDKVGQSLDDLLAEELHKPDLDSHPGWTTLDEAGIPKAAFSHESDAFVGFGACTYKKVTKDDFESAKEPAEMIKVLSVALRTYCVTRETQFYKELLKDELISLNDDKVIELSSSHKYISADKLTPEQRSSLSRALELASFSKAFKAELFNDSPQKAPKDTKISRRVKVFADAILEGVQLVKTKLKHHEVKLLRSLSITTKTAFMKLLQDYESTKDCEECSDDLEVIEKDMQHLMAIMEFIVHDSAVIDKDPAQAQELFKTFKDDNEEVITERVDAYLTA